MPQNVVIIAQEAMFNSKVDHSSDVIQPTVGAALIPSIAKWLNPACSYVVQTFKRPKMVKTEREVNGEKVETWERTKGVEFCLRTEPHDVFMTKFRIPITLGETLPDVIVNPTYAKIDALVKGRKLED